MKKRKANTLVELLVGIMCSTIILAAVGSSMVFIIQSTTILNNDASTYYKLSTLKDYIMSDDYVVATGWTYVKDEKALKHGEHVVLSGLGSSLCSDDKGEIRIQEAQSGIYYTMSEDEKIYTITIVYYTSDKTRHTLKINKLNPQPQGGE